MPDSNLGLAYRTLDATKGKRLLESLGFQWNCIRQDTTAEEHFVRNFDLLLAFQEREGHVWAPTNHQESVTVNLGAWLYIGKGFSNS
jgi:hypothetical protein